MPSLTTLGLFVAATVALILIPGPSTFYLLGRGLTAGRRVALIAALGIETGSALFVFLVGVPSGLSRGRLKSEGRALLPCVLSAVRPAGSWLDGDAGVDPRLSLRGSRSCRRHSERLPVRHDGKISRTPGLVLAHSKPARGDKLSRVGRLVPRDRFWNHEAVASTDPRLAFGRARMSRRFRS